MPKEGCGTALEQSFEYISIHNDFHTKHDTEDEVLRVSRTNARCRQCDETNLTTRCMWGDSRNYDDS